MPEIRSFKCTYENSVGICEEVTSGLGLEFPEAYKHADSMQVLAEAIKEHDGADFVLLPFCRTVEAEAMGADVNFGDARTGPRAGSPVCTRLEDLLALPDIDLGSGRISELLGACENLKKKGETVCLEVTGPFTIMNALMEPRLIFKNYRKNREGMKKVFDRLSEQLIAYIAEARKRGVDIFIFSDSAGALDILGPGYLADAVEDFYHPFLRNVSDLMDESCIMLLCPKFTFAMTDTGHADIKEFKLDEGIPFLDALLCMRGTVKIAGQACIKNIGVKLANGVFRECQIKESL